jgi:hypothetical protein
MGMSKPFDPEVVAEHTLGVAGSDDVLECGLLRTKPHKMPVAYAKLGETTVSIYRGVDGDVQVEIDDASGEDVYVTANLMTLRAYPESDRATWHSEG